MNESLDCTKFYKVSLSGLIYFRVFTFLSGFYLDKKGGSLVWILSKPLNYFPL